MKTIPIDIARALITREAANLDIEVIYPDDPRRIAVALAMAAVHVVTGAGWDLDDVRTRVSCTLPGVGHTALSLLRQIPQAGPVLAGLVDMLAIERPIVCLSPMAMTDGASLAATWRHELGHVGQMARGGIPWCAAYALGIVRGAAEAQCYGSDLAFDVRWQGASVEQAVDAVKLALGGYKLDADQLLLADRILLSDAETLRIGGDPGGIVAETEHALEGVGWQG